MICDHRCLQTYFVQVARSEKIRQDSTYFILLSAFLSLPLSYSFIMYSGRKNNFSVLLSQEKKKGSHEYTVNLCVYLSLLLVKNFWSWLPSYLLQKGIKTAVQWNCHNSNSFRFVAIFKPALCSDPHALQNVFTFLLIRPFHLPALAFIST